MTASPIAVRVPTPAVTASFHPSPARSGSRVATRLAAAVAALSLLAGSARAQEAKKFDYLDKTLPNGLRVVALEDFTTPVVAVQVWYHVGSKNENPERQGFAHMFEHMMFRGTERLGPKAHFELIRQVGGDCNAYTSFDQTVYIQKLPANQLELALYLEAERMAFLKVDQDSFSTERAVVEEERRQGLNAPYGTVYERALAQIFKQHPYQWTPIGQIPHLRQAKVDELARFWETYYVPNNATLVVVGAVKKEEVLAQAEKYLAWVPRGETPPQVQTLEPPQTEPREIRLSESPTKAPVTIAAQAYRTVPLNHPDAVALDVLAMIVGGGESSRLYQILVKEKDIAAIAAAESFNLEQDGLFGAGAVCKPGGGSAQTEILKVIDEQFAKIKAEGVTPEELEKAKLNLLKSQVGQAQTVENRARLLGTYAVLYGDLDRVNKRFDEIRAVTAADVQRVANTYLRPERLNKVIVEPSFGELLKSAVKKEDQEGPPPAPVEGNPTPKREGSKALAVRPPTFPTTAPTAKVLEDFPLPKTAERTLASGLKVVIVPRHDIPLVTLTLGLKNGAWTEKAPGSASLAASLITQGTENYTSRALAEELDRHAISLGASVGIDTGTVTASCLTEQSDLAMKLLAEVVLRPIFPQTEFDQSKTQTLTGLTVSEQNPKFLAERELNRRIYGDHPYGRSASGEIADVKKLTREDAAGWWKSFVRPDTSVLYIAGDLEPEAGFALAEKYLGEWKADGPAPAAKMPEAPGRNPTTIYLVNKSGLVQSEIRLGQVAITRQDPRWHVARVLTQVFGGSFGSRLNEAVRVKKGLTYGIFGYFKPAKESGILAIETFSKTPTTAQTIQATLEEIVRMKADPIEQKELEIAKNFLVGSFAGSRQTPQDTINDLWLIESTGLSKTFLRDSLAGVARTEESDVRELAQQTLDEKQITIVVVGDAAKIKADLEKVAPVIVLNESSAQSPVQPSAPAPSSAPSGN